jgi:phosphoglycerol transferase MdoB-like AlkP superfamily enzyme
MDDRRSPRSAGHRRAVALRACALAGVGVAFLSLASAEPSVRGGFAVLLLLSTSHLALLTFTGRTAAASLIVLVMLGTVVYADALKYAAFAEHVHVIDLLVLFEYLKSGSLVLVSQYRGAVVLYALYALGIAAASALVWRLEGRWGQDLAPLLPGACATPLRLLALANLVVFFLGNWYWSSSNQYVYARMKKAGSTSMTHVLAGVADLIVLSRDRAPSGEPQNVPKHAADNDCGRCPDIIIVHLESVFDPAIMAAFDGDSMFGRLDPRLIRRTGMLQARMLAGYSFVSEFSFNCGLDHRLFGMAGQYPNLFLAPTITGCAPHYLKTLGYSTEVISSVIPEIMRYGMAYRAYGYDAYFPPGSFAIPHDWVEMRDGHFVDAAIEQLSAGRSQPRLMLLLTVFNHGPHGSTPAVRRDVRYPGPYSLRNLSEEETDYVNRLNDSLTAFRRLESFVAASDTPTLLIYYGDHQPYFQVTYSEDARRRFGPSVRYVTGFSMARNYPIEGIGPGITGVVPIEQLFAFGLEFGGLRPSPVQTAIRELAGNCLNDQTTCDASIRSKLRNLILDR